MNKFNTHLFTTSSLWAPKYVHVESKIHDVINPFLTWYSVPYKTGTTTKTGGIQEWQPCESSSNNLGQQTISLPTDSPTSVT